VGDALAIVGREALDRCILDLNLRGENSAPVAQALKERGVVDGLPCRYAGSASGLRGRNQTGGAAHFPSGAFDPATLCLASRLSLSVPLGHFFKVRQGLDREGEANGAAGRRRVSDRRVEADGHRIDDPASDACSTRLRGAVPANTVVFDD
jgi:hypothetical protein